MQCIRTVWNQLKANKIHKCFGKAGITKDETQAAPKNVEHFGVHLDIPDDNDWAHISSGTDLDNFVDCHADTAMYFVQNEDEIIKEVVPVSAEISSSQESEELDGESVDPPTLSEALTALEATQHYIR
ncbi:uncharacterized protein LOC126184456 [Schistocerca cancellata]|uniref:uncharacterized protein LOC126184456 n=1 Tax=Schistocerca cancellata TaxID=274614 RepID=UPI00211801FE|nr:uncharacterized protein LOC126184456 [Schistocerca cancellata]